MTLLLTLAVCVESKFAHCLLSGVTCGIAQGLTWREVPAPAPQPGRPPLRDAASLIQFSYHKSLEVRPPCSSCPEAEGVCFKLVLEWQGTQGCVASHFFFGVCRQSAQQRAQGHPL